MSESTRHELEIVARASDLVTPTMNKMATSGKAALDGLDRSAAKTSASLSGIGKALGGSEKLGRGLGVIAGGLAMIQGNSQSASNELAGGLTRAAGAFLVGGPVALGFTAVSEVVGYFGRQSAAAAEKQRELAEASKRAAAEAQQAASQQAKAQADFVQGTERQIALINAASDAERRRLEGKYAREDANAQFGVGSAGAGKADELTQAKEHAALMEESKKQDAEFEKARKKKAEGYEEEAKSIRERRASLSAEIDEVLRRSKLTQDELKYSNELKLIADAVKEGDLVRAQALRDMLDTMREQATQAEKLRDAGRAYAEAAREVAGWNKEASDAAKEEFEARSKAFSAGGKVTTYDPADAPTEDPNAPASPAGRRGGGGGGGGGGDAGGGVVDLRAQARAEKRQRARDARTERRNANFLAENRERMGFVIDGDDDGRSSMRAGGGDMDATRKHTRFSQPSGLVPNAPQMEDPSLVNLRGGRGGSASSQFGAGPVLSLGGDAAPADTRGQDQAKSLEEAIAKNDEAMKAFGESMGKSADAATRTSDTTKEIATVQTEVATKAEETATSMEELRTQMDRTATAFGEISGPVKEVVTLVTKLAEDVQALRDVIDTIQKAA